MSERIISNCDGCGACCSNARMLLNDSEAEHLRAGNSNLEVFLERWRDMDGVDKRIPALEALMQVELEKDEPSEAQVQKIARNIYDLAHLPDGMEIYDLLGDCGYLVDGLCTDYENRPEVCSSFEVGSAACVVFRTRLETITVIEG